MDGPSKRQIRLRSLAVERWSARKVTAAASDSPSRPGNESEEPEEVDGVYLIESDSAIDEEEFEKVQMTVLKWKKGEKLKRPAAFSGDGRWTKWRRGKKEAERIASVADCHQITDFFSVSTQDSRSCDDNNIDDTSSDDMNDDVFDDLSRILAVCSIAEALDSSQTRPLGFLHLQASEPHLISLDRLPPFP